MKVVWERIIGMSLDAAFMMRRDLFSRDRHEIEQSALKWSHQLFSALSCLHSNGEILCHYLKMCVLVQGT